MGSSAAGLRGISRLIGLFLCGYLLAACGPADVGKAEGGQEPAAPLDIVLISIDTLRADHLGCYGYERPTSPRIDELARGGVLLERAFAPSSWTLPSHATMFTGLSPFRHGATGLRRPIRDDVRTLPEIFHEHGYRTAGVVNGVFVKSKLGFGRGFERYEQFRKRDWQEHQEAVLAAVDRIGAETETGAVTETGTETGAEADEQPFFLFFHYMTVHDPYAPPEEFDVFRGPYDGDVDTESSKALRTLRQRLDAGRVTLDEVDRQFLVDRYDGGIRFADSLIGELLDRLEGLGRERLLVVVTSDHGEEFLEHGGMLHNTALYDETIRVPLILHGAGLPAGGRVSTLAGLVDLAPTLLDLADIRPPEGLDGGSLARLLRRPEEDAGEASGRPGTGRDLALWTGFPDGQETSFGVRTTDRKLIVPSSNDVSDEPGPPAGSRELYDLIQDPGELSNLYAPAVAASLEQRLRRRIAVPSRGDVPLSDEDIEELRAVGYVD